MNKISQKLLAIILLSVLICSFFGCAFMVPGTYATELTATQKSLNILHEVFGINLEEYTITTHETNPEFPWLGDDIEDVSCLLISGERKLFINFFFTNGNLQNLYVFENNGVSELKLAANNIASAHAFLETYEQYSSKPLFGELSVSLNNIVANKNETIQLDDKILEVTVYGNDELVLRWCYSVYGATSYYNKVVALSFTNGTLMTFTNKWDLYPIGSTEVNLTKEQAIEIALEAVKNNNWTMTLNDDVFDPARFNALRSISWVSLGFVNSQEADNPRPGNELTLYPVWQIGVVFNEFFGYLYGAEVDIWADTQEIRSIKEEHSYFAAWLKDNPPNPDPSPTPSPTSSSSSSSSGSSSSISSSSSGSVSSSSRSESGGVKPDVLEAEPVLDGELVGVESYDAEDTDGAGVEVPLIAIGFAVMTVVVILVVGLFFVSKRGSAVKN